jgi:hypothetical protein
VCGSVRERRNGRRAMRRRPRAADLFRCPQCQVAICSEYGSPEVRFVRGGTLDDPTDIRPDVHIYTRSKVDWVTLPEGTPAFEEYYDHKKLWPAEGLRRLDAVLARS